MKKRIWTLTNDSDGNDTIDLKATDEKDALYEALEQLGWNLGYREEEEEDKLTCDDCRKCGETTCGNDTENLSCFEPRCKEE